MIFNTIKPINEVYFGKTPEILAIEKQLDIFRSKYIGQTLLIRPDINSDKDLLKFNRMIEDYFGFEVFSLHITKSSMRNAWTIAVSSRYDVLTTHRNLVSSKNGFKYNKDAGYAGIVNIYTAMIFNKEFTTSEIMAIIMHEIGHNFFLAINNNYIGYELIYKITSILELFIKAILVAINSDEDAVSIGFTIKLLIRLGLLNNKTLSIYEKMEKAVRTNVPEFLYVTDLLDSAISIMKDAKFTITQMIKRLTLGFGMYVTLPIGIIASILLNNPFTSKFKYNNEQFSDNFVTMYGYSDDLISILDKLSDSKTDTNIFTKTFDDIPILSDIYYLNENVISIIYGLFDEHPTELMRCKSQIDMLKRELEKNDLDPKMKRKIQYDLDMLEIRIKEIINLNKAIEDKQYVKRAYYAFLYNNSNSKDLKDIILQDNKKFEKYDKMYTAKQTVQKVRRK